MTIGCNALYREYTPDFLVSFDKTILQEVIASDYPNERICVPAPEFQREPAEFNEFRPRENAGMISMRFAIESGKTELYCLGMDFLLDDYDLNLGNVYDGTNGYGMNTRANYKDTINRCRYFEWFANKHPNVTFYTVFPQQLVSYRHINANNVKKMYYHDLINLIQE